jgi:prepilin-type processing-associated H-X9-DG protein
MNRGVLQFPSASANKSKSGFTRTELLVVIGVIAMLVAVQVALLLTALPRIKDERRRAQCENNLAQIGLAVAQYAQEHDKMFPKDWENNRTAPQATEDESSPTGAWCNQGFDARLLPYLQSRRVFVCPTDIWLNRNLSPWGRRNSWDDTSYGINLLVQNQPQGSVANPAETILLGHTRFEHTLFEDRRSVLWDTHQNGNNYLFCDGHVQFLNGTATLNPKNLWSRGELRKIQP